jgi:hypothetical protein
LYWLEHIQVKLLGIQSLALRSSSWSELFWILKFLKSLALYNEPR